MTIKEKINLLQIITDYLQMMQCFWLYVRKVNFIKHFAHKFLKAILAEP